jgi:tellurite resistance protein TerC
MNSFLQGYALWEIVPFIVIVLGALWIDLKAHGGDKPVTIQNAAVWSAIWVMISVGFAGFLFVGHGSEKASLFLSGYLLEKSLSVDNLFVFMAIFASFGIKDKYQHRILYFGILGALLLRFLFIGFGTGLAMMSEWVLFGFGLIVLWSAYAMWRGSNNDNDDDIDYAHHWSVKWVSKVWPVYPRVDNHNFFCKENGIRMVTPLFLCLVVVEISDVVFAFDSVPAIIAITKEPFLVYTSNIFAILGLRSMYFLLSAAKRYLCHLEKAVIGILIFIGSKMIVSFFGYHISANISLMVVLLGLVVGITMSFICPEKELVEV